MQPPLPRLAVQTLDLTELGALGLTATATKATRGTQARVGCACVEDEQALVVWGSVEPGGPF